MNKKEMYKNLLIFLLVFMSIMLLLGALFYFNLKKEKSITVKGTVQYVGDDYIIIVDNEEQEYSVSVEDDYQIGDRVSVIMKNVNKKITPIEGETVNVNAISKSITFSITDGSSNDHEEKITANSGETASSTEPSTNNTVQTVPSEEKTPTEEDVISYFETMNLNIDRYQTDQTLGESLKSGFVSIVDFLFYGGTIKGKTFADLSDTTKLKVLTLFLKLDHKIETYFPNYKEELSSTGSRIYTNVKAKAIESYLNITTKVCQNRESVCDSAKEGLSDLKRNFSITWDFIKDISGVGVSKLKAWYEVWKDAK